MVGGDARCWCADPPSADALPVPAPGSPASCFCPACLAARREGGARRNVATGVKLLDKILLVSAIILAVLVCVLTGLSALSLKQFSLYTAERHARSVAETVKVGLTESMINGTIKTRQQFLARLAGIPGVSEVRVARGPAVIAQFGPGFAAENATHHDVKDVLSTGREIFELVEINGEPVFHAVIPYVASDQGLPNCLQCHAVRVGTVLGAVQVDIPFSEVRHQGRIAVGLVGLAVLLAALAALALLRKLLQPLSETAQAVQEVTSRAVEGDFGGRVLQRSSDEVGGIALNINQLMDFLQREVGTIRKRVGELMGFSSDGREINWRIPPSWSKDWSRLRSSSRRSRRIRPRPRSTSAWPTCCAGNTGSSASRFTKWRPPRTA
jgi:HAMP domain-containing protein